MIIYNVTNPESPFSAIEFSPQSEGNLTFFYVNNAGKLDKAKERLEEMGQALVSETPAEGRIILITRGSKTKEELIRSLKDGGDALAQQEIKHSINWWSFRGNMSNAGQMLQLISALKEPRPSEKNNFKKPKYAADQGMFAILNLAANFTNIIFGGQKEKDPHRLLYIKENQNKLLADNINGTLPDINEEHVSIRREPPPPQTLGQRFYAFMQKNSVRFGEIGLRYLGSVALVFPIKFEKQHWKNIGSAYREGGLKSAFSKTINTSDKFNLASGITYLVGKTLALFSKVPDPYNPKPETMVSRIREKYVFRTATAIETVAAGTLAEGNRRKDKPMGAIGGTLFMGAFATRFLAPFGNREVNTEEVFAYTSDLLAEVPHEKLPQMVAASAAQLAKDLSGYPNQTFGSIYTRLTSDLYRYHNIAVGNSGTENPELPKDKEIPHKDLRHGEDKHDIPPMPEDQAAFINSSSQLGNTTGPMGQAFSDKVATRLGTDATQSI